MTQDILIDSAFDAWVEIKESAMAIASGDADKGFIYTHTNYANAFVFVDEAIPLPNKRTAMFWRYLYGLHAPHPLVPWKGGQRLTGSTEPLDYCQLQSDEVMQIAGVRPERLHYGVRVMEPVSDEAGLILSDSFQFPNDVMRMLGVRIQVPATLLAQATMLGMIGLFPGNIEVQEAITSNLIGFKEVPLLGFTSIITSQEYADLWLRTMRNL